MPYEPAIERWPRTKVVTVVLKLKQRDHLSFYGRKLKKSYSDGCVHWHVTQIKIRYTRTYVHTFGMD